MAKGDISARANQSSGKLLTILECLSLQQEPLRLQELSRLLSMNESTTLRYLSTLEQSGYVFRDCASGRYVLTFKICALASNVSQRNSLRNLCGSYLRLMAQVFAESVNLAEEHDLTVVYIEVANGPGQLVMTTRRAGNTSPMHCTAVGKLLLQSFSTQQFEQFIARKGLPRLTPNTITQREVLLQELEKIKQQGYAIDNEEYEAGARCIAAPIRDYTGRVVAGISVSGPVIRMTDAHIFEKLPFLLDAAQQVSIRMGFEEEKYR